MPRNSEAPMSFSASISARLTPTAIAGPRQRQRHAEEDAERFGAERARHFERRRRLHQEERADRQIDVRVEHDAEQEDAAVRASGSRGTRDRAAARCREAREASSAPARSDAARRDRRRRRCRSARRAAGAAPIRRCAGRESGTSSTSQAVPTPIDRHHRADADEQQHRRAERVRQHVRRSGSARHRPSRAAAK